MKTTLPPVLESKLAEFRRRVWTVKLTEGVLAALFGLLLSYFFVFVLDRFMETPSWLRLALMLGGAAALGVGLPWKWHRWVWRQRRLEDAARLLRRTFPRLGDQLLGIVELARLEEGRDGRSERLVQAAMAQAADAVKDKDFTHAVPDARHRQWGIAVAAMVAVALAAFVGVNEAARNALLRWLMPWEKVERYTFARVETLPDRLVVPLAEPFDLPVKLAKDSRWTPGTATARIGDQEAIQAALQDDRYPLTFPPQKALDRLSLTLGDVRKTLTLQPLPRPELEDVSVHLKLPAYLGYRSEQNLPVRGGMVSIVRGAEASFAAAASRDLAAAALDGTSQPVQGRMIRTAYSKVEEDRERKMTWQDVEGLAPRDPFVLRVRAVEDEAPKVMARRDSLEQVVLDSEVVTFDLSATDDFGVQRAGLEWLGAPPAENEKGKTRLKGDKVAAAGAHEKRELAGRATFCAVRDGVSPQTIEVRAWADDYLPGRQRSRSAAFTLHILNKTDHALWLTEQFGKWIEAARESYEVEQQLHQTNKELRELSAAELDRPENRRKVAQQAAAENANAARLDQLTSAGRRLVEQATKNDEFDATRLESWATLLKSLKDIAANRMPGVTDLLKQSANAEGRQPGSSPKEASPQAKAAQPSPGGKEAKTDSAPTVSHGQDAASPPAPKAPDLAAQQGKTPPPAPGISDKEAGMGKAPEGKSSSQNAKPPGAGKLGLPSTQLGAVAGKGGTPPPESPAQEKMDQAISQQRDLLTEFAKVSDELSAILASLESSTFVKRFKAASRKQLALAGDISQQTLDSFGIERQPPPEAAPLAEGARSQSEFVHAIQSDLEAYFQRKQDSRFKDILDQMKKTEVVRALARGGDKISVNLTGQSIAGSEYWADVFDRWAEELVAASNCKSCSSSSGDSLPPEIVLKVMQALRDEMKLRDETRELDQSRAAIEETRYMAAAQTLSRKQASIGDHTQGAVNDIKALPEGEVKFHKEISLLTAVVTIMDEAQGLLGGGNTGPDAVAAETEAIELLLQAKRSSPNGGGGGGSNPGGGGTAERASLAALAELGEGADVESQVEARPVGQATGRTGKEFPEEFKAGLDAYFNRLENTQKEAR